MSPIITPSALDVVILDDADYFHEIYTLLLPSHARITSFEDGAIAWRWLSHHDPDLLITGLSQPGMGGLELLEKLSARHAQFPVLVISGIDWPDEVKAAGKNLKLAILSKSLVSRQFTETLNSLLR